MKYLVVLLSLVASPYIAVVSAQAEDLKPLRYNHPGLEVDLGVGLWAWPVPCDADGDGDFDLIVSCPDKPSNGIWLFENAAGDTAQNKFPVFKAARRLSSTVHYVMPSYVDGGLRVLTPGREHQDFTRVGLERPISLPVAANFYKPQGKQTKGPKVRHNQWRYTDYDGDGALDLVVGIEDWSDYGWDDAWNERGEWTNGPLHGFVYLFRNTGTTAEPVYADPQKLTAAGRPIDVYGCPSPNFEDFDGDGDLDLLCGEFVDGFTYFENTGTRTEPQYAAGRRLRSPDGSLLTMDLQMIVPIVFDWDRDGDFDLVVGDEDGRVALVENTGRLGDDRVPQFLPPRYFQQEADQLKCGALATPVGFDWDGDDDIDILSGNTAGYIEFFENLSGPRVEEPKWAAPVRLEAGGETFRIMAGPNGSIQGPAEAKWGYTTLSVADWDHDGLPDIVVNGIWGKVRWLKNVGSRTEPKLAAPQAIEVQWPEEPPKPRWTWWSPSGGELVTQWRTTPVAIDWNRDELVDLVMLDHEGYLAFYERAKRGEEIVLLPPQRVFYGTNLSGTNSQHKIVDATPGLLRLNTGTAGGSGRRKLHIVDWDGDGNRDLLVNSINANLLQQTAPESASQSASNEAADQPVWHFTDRGPLLRQSIQGHTTSPATVDFNGDQIPDFLGGAEDGRFYYRQQTR
ncbi:FG-GAP-like repeat-containing protein [Candidatus Laterigemmans baculatus]|uniref:FG-GAP-like repeat-containing protein n=1 Tax=Candidatus Laterigemmans baculatus TaxID=2770505 RepID=UPI0013DC7673|nr:FG-GAP-like repeat-containing protein [Candidatus Laterigemmans baculatus]